MDERYPVYAEADLTVESRDVPHEAIVDEIIEGLRGCVVQAGAARGGRARHDRAASLRRSDHRQRRARRPRLRHRDRPRAARVARRADREAAARAARSRSSPTRRWRSIISRRREAALAAAGIDAVVGRCRPAKASKSFRMFEQRLRRAARGQDRARRSRGRARRRRGRRSRRLLPRRSCAAASTTCRCRPRCWRRSIPRSAARPRSIPATART